MSNFSKAKAAAKINARPSCISVTPSECAILLIANNSDSELAGGLGINRAQSIDGHSWALSTSPPPLVGSSIWFSELGKVRVTYLSYTNASTSWQPLPHAHGHWLWEQPTSLKDRATFLWRVTALLGCWLLTILRLSGVVLVILGQFQETWH